MRSRSVSRSRDGSEPDASRPRARPLPRDGSRADPALGALGVLVRIALPNPVGLAPILAPFVDLADLIEEVRHVLGVGELLYVLDVVVMRIAG